LIKRIGEEPMKQIGACGLASALAISILTADTSRAQQVAPEAASPRTIALATASPGGVYLVYGQALARILSHALHIEVTAEATQGAVQNVILLEKRATMLAFINMGPALQGWNGSDWAKGTHYRSMRVMFPMYDTAFQFVVAKRLRARSLDGFSDLRIGGGPRGGTSGAYIERVFKALGVTALVRHGAWDNLISQLAERELDGAAAAIGAPFPVLVQVDAQQLIEFVEPTSEQRAVIRKEIREISPSTIAAGTYPSLTKDYQTIGLYNFAVAHKDLSEDLVYKIVKTTFENHAQLVKAHPAAKETVPENIDRNTLLPLHPGALRYYREKGITVPVSALGGTN
jgi:TRAP transporter TAXI family solute receptor